MSNLAKNSFTQVSYNFGSLLYLFLLDTHFVSETSEEIGQYLYTNTRALKVNSNKIIIPVSYPLHIKHKKVG